MPDQPAPKNSLELLDELCFRPRIGRRFSLRPGPFAPRQKQWKRHLPWQVWAEIDPAQTLAMQEAFGIDAQTAEGQQQWEQVIQDLADARLFLRVIRLHDRYRIPPGETTYQCQTRLDRWLPPPFKADAKGMQITWTSPVRFACPAKSITVNPLSIPMLCGVIDFNKLESRQRSAGGACRWLHDGQLFLLVNSSVATPAARP